MIGGSGYNILTIWLVGAVIIYIPYALVGKLSYTYHMMGAVIIYLPLIGGSGYNIYHMIGVIILTIWLVGAVIIYLPYDWWERL